MPRSSWVSTHIWPFMYNGHTPTLTSIHSILTTREGTKIRQLPAGLVWPGISHCFSTFLDPPSVSKVGLCSVFLNSTDTMTWERNGGVWTEISKRRSQGMKPLSWFQLTQNNKQSHKQMLSAHMHMLLPMFMRYLLFKVVFQFTGCFLANDYHNTHIYHTLFWFRVNEEWITED